jgi:hypothetical protein
MRRRDFVRAMLAAGAAPKILLSQQPATPAPPPPAPVPWLLGLNAKTPIPQVEAADEVASGLDWLDGESKKKFNTGFAQLTDLQAGELLKPWMRTWLNDHPPEEIHADFINIAHDDIRTATVNSREWSAVPEKSREPRTEEELYWSPIQPDLHAQDSRAANAQPHVQAVPPSGHHIPAYPR